MWYRLSDGPKATDSPSKQDKGKSSMMYSLQQKKNAIVGASTRTNTTSEITKICLCTGIWPAPRRNNQNIPMYSYLTCVQPIWGFFWISAYGVLSTHVRLGSCEGCGVRNEWMGRCRIRACGLCGLTTKWVQRADISGTCAEVQFFRDKIWSARLQFLWNGGKIE